MKCDLTREFMQIYEISILSKVEKESLVFYNKNFKSLNARASEKSLLFDCSKLHAQNLTS